MGGCGGGANEGVHLPVQFAGVAQIGETALMSAASNQGRKVVRRLLDHGADLNASNEVSKPGQVDIVNLTRVNPNPASSRNVCRLSTRLGWQHPAQWFAQRMAGRGSLYCLAGRGPDFIG